MMVPNITWIDDVSVDCCGVAKARNLMLRAALRLDCDGVMWVDSDMLVPNDAFLRLSSHDVPFVSALYFCRNWPHRPACWPRDGNYPENSLWERDGTGFGCVYTSSWLLRQLGPDPFGEKGTGEDYDFCQEVRALGVPILIDTYVRCGHFGNPELVTEHTFRLHNNPLNTEPN